VIVHEFGHAIGAIHEHSVPTGGIVWNLPAVYRYFGGPPNNWSKEDIDFNIIQKYSVSQLNGTTFDKRSIMLYSFPPELILGPASLRKSGTPENTQLSTLDKSFIARFYKKSGTSTAASRPALEATSRDRGIGLKSVRSVGPATTGRTRGRRDGVPSAPKTTRPVALSRREPPPSGRVAWAPKRQFDTLPDRIDIRDWPYRPSLISLPDVLVSSGGVPAILDQGPRARAPASRSPA